MQYSLAQIIALTCHANAALAGWRGTYFPDHLTCRYCQSVTFVELKNRLSGAPQEVPVAATPDEWFATLIRQRASGALLTFGQPLQPDLPDRIATAFVGGDGDWSIDVILPDERWQRWVARWGAAEQETSDQRTWAVTYGCVGTFAGPPSPPPDLKATHEKLERALVAIRSFAERQKIDNFARIFSGALDCLGDTADRRRGDKSVEAMFPPLARSVLEAAQSAWVFGGMGSWNDMGFAGEADAEYRRVSDDLYAAIREAIVAGASGTATVRTST